MNFDKDVIFKENYIFYQRGGVWFSYEVSNSGSNI